MFATYFVTAIQFGENREKRRRILYKNAFQHYTIF